ncbi:hypothetical protein HMPREF1980_01556 [Actinomyces sp. oral taxon 172 str. F0311]|nr:hypothetical protein HMPREF1980_01556 [Actinomyces sp. oral taxon 172 str. F0311]
MDPLQVDEQIHRSQRCREAEQQVVARHRPRSFDDRGGSSPLVVKVLNFYPQPPTSTSSPTLNSEDPIHL